MANMSYCRFHNTLQDLRDCVYAMDEAYNFEDMELSKEEKAAMHMMYAKCEDFINNYNRLDEMSTENEDEEEVDEEEF